MTEHLPPAAFALRNYLKNQGISQGRFAVINLGTTDTTLHAWLHGRATPSLAHAVRIQEVTGIPVADWVVSPEEGSGRG